MTRAFALACVLFPVFLVTPSAAPQSSQPPNAKTQQQQSPPPPAEPPEEGNPPEEDESVKPKVYPLNPLESDRCIRIGDFYMRQHTTRGYHAAIGRYEDATKYNPSSPEAFFKLAEAEEKVKNQDAARVAYKKALQLAPADSKIAKDAKRRLDSKS